MKDYTAVVKSNALIADNTFIITLTLPESVDAHGGQFANISTGDKSKLLRRPLGICKLSGKELSLCYQVKGDGTRIISQAKAGDKLNVLMPLGNGFNLENYKNIAVIGGGVGVFPLAATVSEYRKDKNFISYIGFRTKSAACMLTEFEKAGRVVVTTDDGSLGIKGNAVDAFFGDFGKDKVDAIIACGPPVMFGSLKSGLEKKGIDVPCFVSLEERMGCGVGACLVCTCKKSKGGNARVCKDGPVFDIKEVEV